MRKCDNAFVGKKLKRYESSVRGCIVIMEQRIARAPQFRLFSPNILPQPAKNFAVELGVNGLAFGYKFMVHNPSNVEKHSEHTLGWAAALPRLLRSWGSWALPLRRLLFNLYPTARHIWCRLGSARRTNAPYVLRCGHLNRCACVAINVYKS